jgi:putative ABC transport system permease protein
MTSWWVVLFIIVAILATLALGGFGIWNGMMSAVQARTREIGLKKAMGAEDQDILKQFLSEAVCLGVGSAMVGILLGHLAITWIAALLESHPPRPFFLASVALGLMLSLTISLVAGFYPARRASQMDVVTAMRYE